MSVSDYAVRMNKVLDYIDAHLDEPLNLEALANVAHFSTYHFHRLFSAWFGETLGDYLRRRRVTVAATRLMTSPVLSVLDAALSVGFGSGEAFARAFKLQFGCSPSAWRKQRAAERVARLAARDARALDSNSGQTDRNPGQAFDARLRHHGNPYSHQEIAMKVDIIAMPPARVAYLRYIGPHGAAVNTFWEQTFWPWAKANGLDRRACYGISHDDPGITPADKCRYDAAVEVADDFVPHGRASVATLPGGRYAAMEFFGTADAIGDAWTTLFRDWIPQSGLQVDARPCLEYYPANGKYDAQTRAFECRLCVPVSGG